MRNQVLTYDIETTTFSENKRKASPFSVNEDGSKRNKVVLEQGRVNADRPSSVYNKEGLNRFDFPFNLTHVAVIVGFNLKFDLLYKWQSEALQEYFRSGGSIFDCQIAEYHIGGMTHAVQMLSLNETLARYGLEGKLDAVRELWEQGYDTDEIPEHTLVEYGEYDVEGTYNVFARQAPLLKKMGYTKAFRLIMDGLLAAVDMEFNGVKIDVAEGKRAMKAYQEELVGINAELDKYIGDLPEGYTFSWTSRTQLSALIFGGTVKYKVRVPVFDEEFKPVYFQKTEEHVLIEGGGSISMKRYFEAEGDMVEPLRYLSGKKKGEIKTKKVTVPDIERGQKMRWEERTYTFPGYTTPLKAWEGANPGVYSTSGEVLDEVAKRNVPFCKVLGRRMQILKDLGTYYLVEKDGVTSGMLSLLYPGDMLHGNFNMCSTVTGRLSANAPNLQNLPRDGTSEVKKMFISRFGDEGRIIAADYQALEVLCGAVMAEDDALFSDLLAGTDLHCKRTAALLALLFKSDPDFDFDEFTRDVIYPSVLATYVAGERPKMTAKEAVYEYVNTHRKDFFTVDGDFDEKGKLKHHATLHAQDLSWWRQFIKAPSFAKQYGGGAGTIAEHAGVSEDIAALFIAADNALYPKSAAFKEKVLAELRRTRIPTNNYGTGADGRPVQLGMGVWTNPTGCRFHYMEDPAPAWLFKRGTLTSFSPTAAANYPSQGLGGEIAKIAMGIAWRRYFLQTRNYDGLAFLIMQVHDAIYIDCHVSVLDRVKADIEKAMGPDTSAALRLIAPNIYLPADLVAVAGVGVNMFEAH